MATTEDIEARLAAYIDGELDDAARAEIERHLASNAHHRVLIEELTRQRDFLRALPRQRAPFEIAENINAHLERSALLGDGDDAHDRIIRISHWPQIKAAAAVVLLVFSLAAVVYYVVSSPGAHEEIAIVAPASVMPDSAARTSMPTTGEAGTVLTNTGLPDLDRHMSISPQISRTQGGLAAEVPSIRGPVMLPAPDRSTMRESTIVAADVDSAPAQQILVAVSAPDPMAAQRNVKSYLLNNHLEFSEEPAESMPEPLKLQASNVGLGSRWQQTRVQMKQSEKLVQKRANLNEVERQRGAFDAEQPSTRPVEHDIAPAPQQPQNFYRVRNLTRNEADALYSSMSDDSQTAVVLQAPSAQKIIMEPMSLSPATQPAAPAVEEWQGLALDLIPLPGLLHLTPPRAQENLEVVIVFNSSAPAELALEPATQPADEETPAADAEPATAPATLPSSP